MEFIEVVGYAAIGLSTCFYICLSIPFFHVLRCKQNFEFTPIGLINTVYVDCVAWYIYGSKLSCDEIMLGHKIGACCSLLLIIIYLGFELKKYLIDTILNALILILGTLVLHKGLTVVIEDSNIVGKICIGTKLITFCIPLLEMSRVFKDKNYKHISLNNTLFCFFITTLVYFVIIACYLTAIHVQSACELCACETFIACDVAAYRNLIAFHRRNSSILPQCLRNVRRRSHLLPRPSGASSGRLALTYHPT